MKLLQNQVQRLQQKVIHLENQLTNIEDPLRSQNKAPEAIKTLQQGDYTLLKSPKGLYSAENDNSSLRVESDILSEESKMSLETLSQSQQYNLSSNQDKALNESNRSEEHTS